MIIEFYNNKGELLASYDHLISYEEIEATKGLLEYENNCTITVKTKESTL